MIGNICIGSGGQTRDLQADLPGPRNGLRYISAVGL